MGDTVSHVDTEADLNKAIAGVVRNAMEEAGFSPATLAKASGMARTTLDRRLTGLTAFTTAELAALARVLKTSLVALLTEVSAA